MASTIPARIVYPATARIDHTDTYHGVAVADPYRWLEDPDAPETKEWVTKQNEITTAHLASASSVRDAVSARMKELCNYERYSCPFRRGDRYFFLKNDGLQNQSVFYKQDSLDAKAEVLLDPNIIEADGTASLGAYDISEDGKYLAYGVSKSGSDWQTVYVRDITTCRDLSDQIPWVKFSGISWTHDHKGFYYSKYPAPAKITGGKSAGTETTEASKQALWYHAIGTSVDADILVYAPPVATWMVSGQVTDDGKYMCITINDSCDPVNRLYYTEIKGAITADIPVIKLIDNFDAEYTYITNDDSVFYFKTNLNAPRYRIIAIDLARPEVMNWKEVVAHSEDVLSYAVPVNTNQMILAYMQHVKHVIKVYNLTGEESKTEVKLPSLGAIAGLTARRQDKEFFYKFVSFLYPGSTFRVDLSTGTTTTFRETIVKGLEASLFEVEQVFYASKDDTKVPMFIIRSKTAVRDGTNPTMLYGYGGFNIALMPSFSVGRLLWITQLGGILAIPNIRGGGEYGDTWHKAGVLLKKQNGFDDFIAAAEYLIEHKYTSAPRLAIEGGSNGGLLVAACTNQRPELFGCSLAHVGVLDMLRFHKFTIGYAWCSDYGSSDNKEQFEYILKYSPIHNVAADKKYPAVLLLTADHDDRVSPLHSYKYISEVQHKVGSNPAQTAPLLIRIETKAGHGGGKPLAKQIEEQADVYAFVSKALGLTWRA